MMKQYSVFLMKTFFKDVHPSSAIVKLTAPGGVPEFGPDNARTNFLEELEAGQLLFFPFSSSNFGEPVRCADDKSRELDDDSDFIIGDVDCSGFSFSYLTF